VFLVQGDVLDTERAATDGVRLILILLVTGSQRELVDEIEGDCALADSHLLRLEV